VTPSEPRGFWGLPQDASVDGWRVDWLLNSTSVFVLIMFAATLVWILWSAFFHGPRHRAHYDVGDARKQTVKAVGLSLLIFLVVDGNLFVNSIIDLGAAFWNFGEAEADPRAVRIEVNARQWAWDVRYPGPDGQFNTRDDIVTMNDVRVPLGRPVLVQLAATDVLHSFSLPNFRVKQDAVPGMINRLRFTAKQTGAFDIACAQHCGVNHYKMRGQLTVLSEGDFAAWATQASALSAEAFDPNDKGAQWGWPWKRGDQHAPHAGHHDDHDHGGHESPPTTPVAPTAPADQGGSPRP
jgi:cytochrome c oxidase subunit II